MIGTSWWADSMHLPALANHPNAVITAICGRNQERAEEMAQRWHIPHAYSDWTTMLERLDLDAVIVSTGNDSHYPITMQALKHGLHVLCEKPLALTYAQSAEMAALAEEKGIVHMVPFTYRFMPTSRYLKELIDDGYLGKPYHLNMRYYSSYARKGDYMWRFDLGKAGSGIIGDLGPHFLYLAEWYFGPIESVSCLLGYNVERPALDPFGNPYELADDMAIVTARFANGASGSIHCTAVAYEDTPFGQSHHMEFHGADGTLYSMTDWDTIQQVSGARVGEGAVKPLPIPDHIWGNVRRDSVPDTYKDIFRDEDFMVRGFISAIVAGQPIKPDFHDGARIQRVVDACIQAHKTKQWVDVDSIK